MNRVAVDLLNFSPAASEEAFLPSIKTIGPKNFVLWYEILGMTLPEIAAEYNLDESSLYASFQLYLEQRQDIVNSWRNENTNLLQVSRLRTA